MTAIERELIRRADANFRELFRAMARLSPHGALYEDDDLLLARPGPLLPLNNAAFVKRLPADPAAALAQAAAFFAETQQEAAFIAANAVAGAIAPFAAALGRKDSTEPGMILAPLAGEPPSVPGLRVLKVEDSATLRLYNNTMTAGFGNAWALGEILDGRALLDAPGFSHYLGLLDGKPCATAMRFASHGIAGVYNVSTIPSRRRRGIGAAITWRAALDGVAEGCDASTLQASVLGDPVYRRMGYRAALTYHTWPPPVAGH